MNKVSRFAVAVSAVAVLTGCYSEQAGGNENAPPDTGVVTPAPSPTPSPTATPTPAPAPTPTGSPIAVGPDAEGIRQLASIASNFPLDGMLVDDPVPGSADPDVLGAFRFTCKPSHLSYDDPIVFPGQKGRTHLHMFFGNTLADANSDYQSLRTTGDSTCNNKLNRSAYWIPALMNGYGKVILPEDIMIYYKRRPKSDPACQTGKGCIALPRGLRYIFGRTMQGIPQDDNAHFYCDGGASGAHFRTLPEVARVCPVGAKVIAKVSAPDCWDGVNLDAPDHRSHMAYGRYDAGRPVCPATHPYRIAQFEIGAVYKVDETLDRSGDMSTSRPTWHFSSDRAEGATPLVGGSTYHADWYGAWDDDILKEWTDHCIDKKLSCSWGRLGSGRRMTFSEATNWTGKPLIVDIPKKPVV